MFNPGYSLLHGVQAWPKLVSLSVWKVYKLFFRCLIDFDGTIWLINYSVWSISKNKKPFLVDIEFFFVFSLFNLLSVLILSFLYFCFSVLLRAVFNFCPRALYQSFVLPLLHPQPSLEPVIYYMNRYSTKNIIQMLN